MNPRPLVLLAALSFPAWGQAPAAPPVPADATAAPATTLAATPATPATPVTSTRPGADAAASGDGPPQRGNEPNVRVTVIEERGKRIEELRVRGQLTRISVRPVGGGPGGYEFLPERDLRDDAEGRSGSNSAVGKRVWRVLAF